MTKAFDNISEGLAEALAIARGEKQPVRHKGWRYPRHSRFLSWSMVRARYRHHHRGLADAPVTFAGPTRRFWPLREQLEFKRGVAQYRRQTGLFYARLRKAA